jgi:hypothetical protein
MATKPSQTDGMTASPTDATATLCIEDQVRRTIHLATSCCEALADKRLNASSTKMKERKFCA